MNQCPLCGRTFTADNKFCLEDGTPLILLESAPMQNFSSEVPTQIIPRASITGQMSAPKDNSKWLFLIIGVLATSVVGMGVFMFAGRGEKGEKRETTNQILNAENANRIETNAAANKPTNAPKTNQTTEQSRTNANLNPAGSWSGNWNSWGSYQTYFTAQMDLTDNGAGKMSGQIVWTLQKSNNPKKIGKVGASATEYVQGTYNAATHNLILQGIRIDDPNGIVIKDRYSLILAENNLTMNGKSKGGNFSLTR